MLSWLPRWRNTSLDLFAPRRYSPQRRREGFTVPGCFGFGDRVCGRMRARSQAIGRTGRTDCDVLVYRVLSASCSCGNRIMVRLSMGMVASAVFIVDQSVCISCHCWPRHCLSPLDTARLFSAIDAECPSAGLTRRWKTATRRTFTFAVTSTLSLPSPVGLAVVALFAWAISAATVTRVSSATTARSTLALPPSYVAPPLPQSQPLSPGFYSATACSMLVLVPAPIDERIVHKLPCIESPMQP